MDQSRKVEKINNEQFFYIDRWVNKNHFRAYVYDEKGNQQLANSFKEYESLTASGIWFAEKPEVRPKRKLKNVASSNSE